MRVLKILLICLFLSQWLSPPLARAQSDLIDLIKGDSGEKEAAVPIDEDIRNKQEELSAQLEKLEEKIEAEALPTDKLLNQKELLEELQLYYQQILEEYQQGQELQKEIEETQEELQDLRQAGKPVDLAPSFSNLDQLEDQRQLVQSRREAAENNIKTLKEALKEERREVETLERERRRAKEEFETNRDTQIAPDLENTVKILTLESQIAQAKVALLQLELQNEKSLVAKTKLQEQLLELKIAWLRKNVQFSESELDKKTSQIRSERKQLTKTLSSLRKNLRVIEEKIAAAPAPLSPEEKQFQSFRRQFLSQKINLLAKHFQRLDELEETWRRRYLLFNDNIPKRDLENWEQVADDAQKEAQRQQELLNARISELRKKQLDLEQQLSKTETSESKQMASLRRQNTLVRDQISLFQEQLSNLFREQQLYQKFLQELEPKVSQLNLGERLGKFWSGVLKIWRFEITSIDDRPITVKKLFFVIILLFVGFKVARRFSQWLGNQVLPHLGLQPGVAAALKTLVFYLFITIITLIVLYSVNVPLTLFTVLGGALAIGVGFGSQNIVRNFIGGLILLTERPIKVGDMVEVEGTHGIIEHIGARSTRIRGFNNVHAIVPNSDLLEKKVINWTLSDDLIRTVISVGVAYGSPTREVARLIRKAVDEHEKVISHPEPIILFDNFGDNALIFQAHFWIKMRVLMDREKILSEIRFRIDELFREAHITIAFPQRDVHLDNLSPIQVRVLPEEDKKKTAKP